jgi:hypothetical protein
MSRSYREDYTEHQVRAFNAQKNNTKKAKDFITLSDEDGIICPNCKKFCTYIYLARNSYCHGCQSQIDIDN